MELKMRNLLPGKGLHGAINVVRAISQGMIPRSSDKARETNAENSALRPSTYLAENQRWCEVETQKAMVISLSRHERWKAGGAL